MHRIVPSLAHGLFAAEWQIVPTLPHCLCSTGNRSELWASRFPTNGESVGAILIEFPNLIVLIESMAAKLPSSSERYDKLVCVVGKLSYFHLFSMARIKSQLAQPRPKPAQPRNWLITSWTHRTFTISLAKWSVVSLTTPFFMQLRRR